MKLDDMPARESAGRNYERIARAIEYLRRHAGEQPDLPALARHIHLSPHHFQRLFTRWAGVSPKRFLQYLTVESAKARLASSAGTLDLAASVGLSGPGRLHDLFVTLEAMSPGEYKAAGAGLAIDYGVHDTPFGAAVIGITRRGICGLHFLQPGQDPAAALRRDWPLASLRENRAVTAPLAARIFDPLAQRPGKPLALLVKGSNFQMKVWRALLALPAGTLASYGGIARGLGAPAAARAVGTAIGANPIAWLIPCHRVIRESGELSRYRWGRNARPRCSAGRRRAPRVMGHE